MKSNLTIKNRYCTIPQARFRKWDEMDVLLWKLKKNDPRCRSGVYYLDACKDAYVQYNRGKIAKHAYAAGIHPELLGGVAWTELKGMPENYKSQMYETERMIELLDMSENKTSFGSMGVQMRTAAITLGLDPLELAARNQLELATRLMEDDPTFQITATYLRDLALFDYLSSVTLYVTNEQYIMAGIRYNRDVERDLDFFICLISNLSARDTDDYRFISYGTRLSETREHIKKLTNEQLNMLKKQLLSISEALLYIMLTYWLIDSFFASNKYDRMLESGDNTCSVPSISGGDRILQATIAASFLLTPFIILILRKLFIREMFEFWLYVLSLVTCLGCGRWPFWGRFISCY